MITITDDSGVLTVRRDGDVILSERPRDVSGSILLAVDKGALSADDAWIALNLIITENPDLIQKCVVALRDLAAKLEQAGNAADFARIAKLEAERDTYRAFVEEVIAGEDGWDAELHVAMARHALSAIEEAGRASKVPERRIVDKDAWIAALEERNRVLEAEFARLSRKLGMNDNHTPEQIVEAVLDELFGGEEALDLGQIGAVMERLAVHIPTIDLPDDGGEG